MQTFRNIIYRSQVIWCKKIIRTVDMFILMLKSTSLLYGSIIKKLIGKKAIKIANLLDLFFWNMY